ncbi:LAG1-DNAbind-domain-containing protein, partial [Fistulina hepatica ATCC 64428]
HIHCLPRPFVDQYVRSPNRLAYGERTVIVLSSRVAQKSYGTEKRQVDLFLCPPPTAILIGNSWWSDVRQGKVTKYLPPKVVVSISGEPEPPEGTVDWCRASGKPFDVDQPPTGTTYIGRCVGKQLYISDFDEKKKKVEALVKVSAPGFEGAQERVIGVFSSRPIKVISKPSKKRQTAKNLELGINHGCTVSLFHRLRSQTVSTKYLCVSGSTSAFKGSDGAPLMGLDPKTRSGAPSFIARTSSWDPFLIYIVDVTKPVSGTEAPPSPVQPDYPSPPPNAIPFPTNGSQIPIYYNQTIVLQCLNSGVVSPVLIIRKVDHQTTAVGGGQQDTSKSVIDSFCALGEVCGDPVSQLHKIALEVYDPNKAPHEPGAPGPSGAFLSCMGEKVNTFRPTEPRQWVTTMKTESVSPPLPDSPTQATGTLSSNGSVDSHLSVDSAPASPTASTDTSNDGGRVRKKRTGSNASCSPIPSSAVKARRRNSAGSLRGIEPEHPNTPSGASWQVDIGETSVWTVVGTDQIRYNFYIPPVLFDQQHSATPGSYPIPSKPVTPFPGVVKYLPPDRAAEVPKHHMMKINPHVSKLLTIYGENFSRTEPVNVYFGTEPSPFTEFRCNEVMGCLPPEAPINKRRPIFLVRYDGVIYPSDIMYP